MKWYMWGTKRNSNSALSNKSGEAMLVNGTVTREGFERSLATDTPSEDMLALSLLVKCVVTALILSILSYYFMTSVVQVPSTLYP
jgi:hypothetical protein